MRASHGKEQVLFVCLFVCFSLFFFYDEKGGKEPTNLNGEECATEIRTEDKKVSGSSPCELLETLTNAGCN